MSWRVNVLEDRVKFPKKNVKKANCELLLIGGCGNYWHVNAIDEENYLILYYDAMEHIDPFDMDGVLEVCTKYKAKGKLLFGSEEGDNKGDYWGYEFDGKGNVKYLKGGFVWTEVKQIG